MGVRPSLHSANEIVEVKPQTKTTKGLDFRGKVLRRPCGSGVDVELDDGHEVTDGTRPHPSSVRDHDYPTRSVLRNLTRVLQDPRVTCHRLRWSNHRDVYVTIVLYLTEHVTLDDNPTQKPQERARSVFVTPTRTPNPTNSPTPPPTDVSVISQLFLQNSTTYTSVTRTPTPVSPLVFSTFGDGSTSYTRSPYHVPLPLLGIQDPRSSFSVPV